MPNESVQLVCRYLRRAARPAEAGDGAVLRLYAEQGDADAFALLVRRHGPMVYGVCRRVLGRAADAEDAFQATFLTLARRARSVRDPDRVGAWLHRVAHRTARRAKARILPTAAGDPPPLTGGDDPADGAAHRELLQVLDEELGRLPERLRAPLVLCYLDGATRDEAAQRLGWSLGTLKRRLEQGRRRLRRHLLARGVAPVGLAAAVLLPSGLRCAVPARLLRATAALGGSFGEGSGVAPAVLSLANEGSFPMSGVPLKSLLAVLVLAGGFAAAVQHPGGEADPSGKAAPAANRPAPQPSADGSGPRTDRFGDPLPAGALHRFGTVRFRHGGSFNDAALSPDGKTLVGCSEVGITLFDVGTGKPRLPLRDSEVPNGFGTNSWKLAFGPGGKTFASIATNGTVRIWDAVTGEQVRRLGPPPPPNAGGFPPPGNPPPGRRAFPVSSICYADGGRVLLASTSDGRLRVYDPENGKVLHQFGLIGPLAGLSRDHETLVAIGDNDSPDVVLYDAATGELKHRFTTEGNLHLAALSPDGKTLVGANTGSEVFFWDVASGKLLRRVRIPVPEHVRNEYLTVLLVTPDGKTVLAGTVRGKILRRELATGKELPPLSGHGDSYVTDMLPHPDGKTLISVGWDGLLRRWDLTTGEPLPAGDGYVVYLHAVLRPDGRLAAVADLAGRLDLWDTVSGRRLRSVRTFGPGLNRLAFSPDGKLLAAAQGDNRVTLWDTAAWRELRSIPLVKPPTPGRGAWFESLTFSPDGRSLLTSCEHDGMRLWAVATGKEVWHQAAHGRAVFSPDGATLVTSGWDETLTFRDPATGNARVTFSVKEQGRSIDDIAFSPDGQSFVTSHHDGTVRFRDPATGRETRRLQICRDVVWEVSFSPDGKWLLSACSDATVRLHEVATGQEVLHLKGHDARVYHGVFGPNGRTALTASWDLTALLWSLRPANIPTFDPDAPWEDLRSEDAPAAYRAAWALLDDPERAVKLLRGKLSPIKREVAPDTVEKLIADLGSANFRTRARAVKDLAELGHAAAPLLRDALPKAKSAEQRERIEGLLARLRREPGPDEWRVMRAVQVLELCGTPEARQLLREWAGGTPGELLTEEAKAALARLK